MHDIVEAARIQLDGLESKRKKLLKIIELAESMMEEVTPDQVRAALFAPQTRAPSTTMQKTVDAVRATLEERGEPLTIGDLLDAVRARGVEIGGKTPTSTLSARLSPSHEFRSYRGIGWWFADKPLPSKGDEDEAAGTAHQHTPAASNPNNGGQQDAAAVAENPDRL